MRERETGSRDVDREGVSGQVVTGTPPYSAATLNRYSAYPPLTIILLVAPGILSSTPTYYRETSWCGLALKCDHAERFLAAARSIPCRSQTKPFAPVAVAGPLNDVTSGPGRDVIRQALSTHSCDHQLSSRLCPEHSWLHTTRLRFQWHPFMWPRFR
ncbi:hypothetical protein J6590_061632 [Homalodisca vitripennis]|nr:hypothetical protein J6590_061630 [Homalodisca vitripennis]KAG8281297.1 hypothetical protein J6590_061632 [Homalodisca vitripennis]